MNPERLMQVVLRPHVSEKTTRVAEKHKQIVFRVLVDANKLEIKKAIELLFNVKVSKVRTVNVKGKVCRFKQRLGRHSDWKKAYVSLEDGYDINFAETELN